MYARGGNHLVDWKGLYNQSVRKFSRWIWHGHVGHSEWVQEEDEGDGSTRKKKGKGEENMRVKKGNGRGENNDEQGCETMSNSEDIHSTERSFKCEETGCDKSFKL